MSGATWLVRGGRVLREDWSTDHADMLVEDGRIAAITRPGDISREDLPVREAADRLLIPGLVNGHTHGHGGLGKGLVGDRVPLEPFLSAGASINGGRTLDDKRLSATLTAVELIRKGCTAFYDLSLELPGPTADGMAAIREAYDQTGIRAVVAPMVADRSLYEALPGLLASIPEPWRTQAERIAAAPAEDTLATLRAILRDWPSGRIRPALGPTIPLHCSDAFLRGCAALSDEAGLPLQTHLAETKAQAVLGLRKYGRSLTAHLDDLGVLGPRFSAAHGIWLDQDDIARLADWGCAVVHNPMSNLRIGSGVAAARAILNSGATLAIGSDASNTSDGQNMFEATRLAAFLSRVADPDPDSWLSAEEAFAAATIGGAKVLGMSDIGRLEPGYRADIVFLDLAHTHYVPMREPLRQMVFAESGAAVDQVMIDGRVVFAHGVVTTVDEAKLRREAQAASDRLFEANGVARQAPSGCSTTSDASASSWRGPLSVSIGACRTVSRGSARGRPRRTRDTAGIPLA
jgi:guanine deaminase